MAETASQNMWEFLEQMEEFLPLVVAKKDGNP